LIKTEVWSRSRSLSDWFGNY